MQKREERKNNFLLFFAFKWIRKTEHSIQSFDKKEKLKIEVFILLWIVFLFSCIKTLTGKTAGPCMPLLPGPPPRCHDIRHNDTQHKDILDNVTQHNDILDNVAQHNDIKYNTQHNDIKHNDIQHNDTQHNDTQHNDTQHNDTEHKDIQHNDIQHNTQHNDTQKKDTHFLLKYW
jgi:hypothetical protein